MTAPFAHLETFLVDSWAEHQRQHDRFTVAGRELENTVLSFVIEPTTVKHYIQDVAAPAAKDYKKLALADADK